MLSHYKKLRFLMLFTPLFVFVPQLCAYEHDYSELFTLKTSPIQYPSTREELAYLVKTATADNKKICIVGASKSQGGQTTSSERCIRISLSKLNKLLMLDVQHKQVRVEAGMTWYELQKYLVPHRLAVACMQSFNNFSIGGSLGVNVHSQDFHAGSIINTVHSCTLLTADGVFITLSRTEQPELFNLVIGGYGLLGIIVEVMLDITDDVMLLEKSITLDASLLGDYFFKHISNNPRICFYSARYSLNTQNPLEKVIIVTYEKTISKSDEDFAFNPKSLTSRVWGGALRGVFNLLTRSQMFKNMRFWLEEKLFSQHETISRNNFMGFSTTSLPADNNDEQYILQEYFIPYEHLNTFIIHLRETVQQYDINVLNVTARHVKKDTQSFLAFAQQEVCALVLYINLEKTKKEYEKIVQWTRTLLDHAIACKGTYYLPYHLFATQEQFQACYPMFKDFIALKKTYDPNEVFSNCLYEKYKNI